MTAMAASPANVAAPASAPTEPENRRSVAKMHLHVSMLALTGITTVIMLHLHLDQTNAALFSFGPLGPSVVTEVMDFIKGL
jgi:hypothetical protein